MKYIVNVLIAAMLMHCSVAWSMFTKTLSQKKSIFAQKSIIEQAGKRDPIRTLAQYSDYIKGAQHFQKQSGSDTNTIGLPEEASQETVDNLAMIYSHAAKMYPQALQGILNSKSMSSLVDMVNLESDLLIKSPNIVLKETVFNRIKKERLSQLEGIGNLKPDYAKEIIKEWIKGEEIDAKLLKLYSDSLLTQKIICKKVEYRYERIVYFNNKKDMAIYFIGDSENWISLYNNNRKFLIKYKNHEDIIDLNDEINNAKYAPILKVVSSNGKFGVINYGVSDYGDSFSFVDFETKKIQKLNDVAVCCFYGDDTLFTINKNGDIYNFSGGNIEQKEFVAQYEFLQMRDIIGSNATGTVIFVASHNYYYETEKDYVYEIKKDNDNIIFETFTVENIFPDVDYSRKNQYIYIGKIRLNNVGSFAAIQTSSSLYIYDIDQKKSKKILSVSMDSALCGFNWTDDDAFLTMHYDTYKRDRVPSSAQVFGFAIINSGHNWINRGSDEYSNICISSDGAAAIVRKGGHAAAQPFYQVALYDDIMKSVVNYFAQPTDQPIQKLFVMKLIKIILDQHYDEYIFDETEIEIYQNYVPQVIKNIFKKMDIKTPSGPVKEQTMESSAAVQAKKSIVPPAFRRKLLERKRQAALYEKQKAQTE